MTCQFFRIKTMSDHDAIMARLQEIFAPPTTESLGKKGLSGIVSRMEFSHLYFYSLLLVDPRSSRVTAVLVHLLLQKLLMPLRMILAGANLGQIVMITVTAVIAPKAIASFVIAVLPAFISSASILQWIRRMPPLEFGTAIGVPCSPK